MKVTKFFLPLLFSIACLVPKSFAANSCQQNAIPAQPPYNTISAAQYNQLIQVILRGSGSLSQGWGYYYPCNVTSCSSNPNLLDLHPGVDLAAAKDIAIFSPVSGTVVARRDGDDCSQGGCLSYVGVYNQQTDKTYFFLHLRTFNVSINDSVNANTTQIGGVGKRGVGGYHVHYEVRSGRATAPASCISGTVDPYANTPFSGSSLPPIPPSPSQAATTWNFERNGDYEGWTATNASLTSVVSGIFFIDPSGDDPYISSPRFTTNLLTGQPDALLYPFVKLKMASNGLDATGAIYFKTANEDFYSPDKVVVFPVNNCSLCGNAPFQEYTVMMAPYFGGNSKWTGVITGIRLDPTGRGQGGTNRDSIGIDYIRLAGWGDLGGGVGDDSPPSLNITSHSDGQVVTTNSIVLSGTASDGSLGDNGIQSVMINGIRAQGDAAVGSNTAAWHINLVLQSGPNTFQVVATDDSELNFFTTRNITINYQPPAPSPTPTPPKTINGRITNQFGGSLPNANVNITDSDQRQWQTSSDDNGNFSISNLTAGKNYFVTPSKNNFAFTPPSWSIFNLITDLTMDFSGRQLSYSISGRIRDEQGNAIDHVKVNLTGGITAETYSNINGDYFFNNLPGGGDVTVKAQKPNYTFLNTYLFIGFGVDEIAGITGRPVTPPMFYGSGFYALPFRAQTSSLQGVLVAGSMGREIAEFSGANIPTTTAIPDSNGVWPTQLAGISVSIGGTPAYILSISRAPEYSPSFQLYYIDFAIPENAPLGQNISVSVRHSPTGLAWFSNQEIRSSAPAFWTYNGTVAGDVVAQDADTFIAITLSRGALTDGSERVVLYGTGLRSAAARGELNIVGRNGFGQEYILPIEYAGPQRNLPGLDEVIVRITPFMAGGASITIWIIGSEESEVTLPVITTPRRP
jgi:uncharacterized protein (TIGR03437 family)